MADLKPLPSPMSWVWKSVEIVEVVVRTSKATRKPYYLLQLQVLDTEYYVYMNLARTERATWKWNYLHEATCGGEAPSTPLWDRDPQEYVKKRMQICLAPVEFNSKWFWEVRKMIHIDAEIPPWKEDDADG